MEIKNCTVRELLRKLETQFGQTIYPTTLKIEGQPTMRNLDNWRTRRSRKVTISFYVES